MASDTHPTTKVISIAVEAISNNRAFYASPCVYNKLDNKLPPNPITPIVIIVPSPINLYLLDILIGALPHFIEVMLF